MQGGWGTPNLAQRAVSPAWCQPQGKSRSLLLPAELGGWGFKLQFALERCQEFTIQPTEAPGPAFTERWEGRRALRQHEVLRQCPTTRPWGPSIWAQRPQGVRKAAAAAENLELGTDRGKQGTYQKYPGLSWKCEVTRQLINWYWNTKGFIWTGKRLWW